MMLSMDSLTQDLRLAFRQLGRRRAFSAIVLATLALGIGATTTFFSVLNGVALRPLPFVDPDQLVAVDRVEPGTLIRTRMTLEQFASIRDSRAIATSAAYVARSVTLSGDGAAAESAAGAEMSGDLFGVLGVGLQRGRTFSSADPAAV